MKSLQESGDRMMMADGFVVDVVIINDMMVAHDGRSMSLLGCIQYGC